MDKAIYYLLDVFTDRKYGGNQLAIFPQAQYIPEDLFPILARELNLSETVYLFPKNKEGNYPMRIFTPASELPTAGHPTVGTAFYLSREIDHPTDRPLTIYFEQKIGKIKAKVDFKNNLPNMTRIYPPLPQFGKTFNNRSDFSKLLSLEEDQLMDQPIQWISCGVPYVIIPLKSIDSVAKIQFRLDVWNELSPDIDNAFIYAFSSGGSEEGSDLHGRMFAPEAGILEDPATGSANGPLGAYVSKYLSDKTAFISEQGYEMGRPSKIFIELDREISGEISELKIGGKCKFIGKGEIYLD